MGLGGKYHREMVEVLLEPGFLQSAGITSSVVANHVQRTGFGYGLEELVKRQVFSAGELLPLLEELLESLGGSPGPNGWLETSYHYALAQAFPAAVEREFTPPLRSACLLFLQALRVVSRWQKISTDGTWQSNFPLDFLSPVEKQELEQPREYKRLERAFGQEYTYEMMKLSQEVMGYSTLDHICGVHYLALFIGRQLKQRRIPIDLGRISGAALAHDIGKYGCKGSELSRVPYLHYYYTDQWLQKHGSTYIRNIAVNHSVWDLELENLSLESLVLIYCDFRVKKRATGTNRQRMYIYSLAEAFAVILSKLDNVDAAKERRYRRVYNKLRDFEDYICCLGITVDPTERTGFASVSTGQRHYALQQGQAIIDSIKFLSIEHNIRLMYKLRDEFSLNAILESARSETDLHNLREYINVLAEYSTYLTQKQKLATIKFLYEQLVHQEEDIRRECAQLIGELIATFDEDYRKAVPDNVKLQVFSVTSTELLGEYLEMFLFPDQKILPVHGRWIGSSLSDMLGSLFRHCRPQQVAGYLQSLIPYYAGEIGLRRNGKLFLLAAVGNLPLATADRNEQEVFFQHLRTMLVVGDSEVRLTALEALYSVAAQGPREDAFRRRIREVFRTDLIALQLPVENYLAAKLARFLDCPKEVVGYYQQGFPAIGRMSSVFLGNLKTSTSWVVKQNQVELLKEYALQDLDRLGLYTAIHLCNLLKVSESSNVRNRAGEALLEIVPQLAREQQNDVVVELLRALEIEGYQYTKDIPIYLGKLILCLAPGELAEVIEDLIKKVKQGSSQINVLLLRTIGVTVENYYSVDNGIGTEEHGQGWLVDLLGVLLNGLVHDNQQVKRVAVSVLGSIFSSRALDLSQKLQVFTLIAKKVTTLVGGTREGVELTFLSTGAALNHFYRFVAEYTFVKGAIGFPVPKQVAFFAGAFDPFSLSHKEIAKEIKALGCEVYLAVDEFSWSKATQPNLVRRQIINMSIADEPDIYLYPEHLPVNIANPKDLYRLKQQFPTSEVFIVVGSDVIVNASAYQKEPAAHSIFTFPHIVFERLTAPHTPYDGSRFQQCIQKITGKVITLSLPPQYEDISSSQIRNYIDGNRDISQLIDPLAQKYIYSNNLYRRAPQYKELLQTKALKVEIVEGLSPELMAELCQLPFFVWEHGPTALESLRGKESPRILLMRSIGDGGRILAFSAFHRARSSSFFNEFNDQLLCEHVRNHAVGRVIILDGFFWAADTSFKTLDQMLITETLTYCLGKDYTYGVFRNMVTQEPSPNLLELLQNHGFEEIPHRVGKAGVVLAVNMTYPSSLYLDIETVIKEPFKANFWVQKAVARCRKRLQKVLTRLYPGNLVLSFDPIMVYENLIKRICDENSVSTVPTQPRKLGPAMCVPFGAILKGYMVPNTITKSLHAERFFFPDMRTYEIKAFPDYLDLENQIKMIKSFDRPVILVDDILHKGYRIKGLDPLLNQEDISVCKIIVGILTGRGKELMDHQERQVDGAYFIPKLRVWFNESLLYPFMGGDTLWRGRTIQGPLVPSVNQILPYTTPSFIRAATRDAVYDLSEVCLVNALEIVLTLEEEYQKLHERSLTLAHLGEVFISSRAPDRGQDMWYDVNLKPSHYLANDLEHLRRLRVMVCDSGSPFNRLI